MRRARYFVAVVVLVALLLVLIPVLLRVMRTSTVTIDEPMFAEMSDLTGTWGDSRFVVSGDPATIAMVRRMFPTDAVSEGDNRADEHEVCQTDFASSYGGDLHVVLVTSGSVKPATCGVIQSYFNPHQELN